MAEDVPVLGVTRWIELDRMERADDWQGWLREELAAVIAREPVVAAAGPVTIREVDPDDFMHAEQTRPRGKAKLFLAEVATIPREQE